MTNLIIKEVTDIAEISQPLSSSSQSWPQEKIWNINLLTFSWANHFSSTRSQTQANLWGLMSCPYLKNVKRISKQRVSINLFSLVIQILDFIAQFILNLNRKDVVLMRILKYILQFDKIKTRIELAAFIKKS